MLPLAIPIAWLQLWSEKLRLLVALFGVAFAVILIFVQLGFQEAMFGSSVRWHESLVYDIAMISPKMDFIVQPEAFPRRRMIQALGVPGVASVSPLYMGQGRWRNPKAPEETRSIYVVGFDPSDEVFTASGIQRYADLVRTPDVVVYDAFSRPEFGPIPALFEASGGEGFETEIANRRVRVAGIFELGTSFGIDANVVTSDLNFQRIFPHVSASQVNIGLIRLEPGADPESVRDRIIAAVPRDVLVLTREGFIRRERLYWQRSTPIGYVLGLGVAIGLSVGGIIVYQILFADVSDHLQEYATLKAMGYTNGFLSGVVLQEAVILAVLGFIPGIAITQIVYQTAGEATRLPLEMTVPRAAAVFGLTVLMCCVSAALAVRKVRSADPAEIF